MSKVADYPVLSPVTDATILYTEAGGISYQLAKSILFTDATLTTTAKTVAGAVNEVDAEMGDVVTFPTTSKNVAGAFNEYAGIYGLDGAISKSLHVTGAILATGLITGNAFVGNGSGLTGIGTGTGGIINTGSTTIGADSDADGVGVVALQTRGVTRLTIGNTGRTTMDYGATINKDLAPGAGIDVALTVNQYAYDGAPGTQWMSVFARAETVAGQTGVLQMGAVYTVLYHSAGYTLPVWRGIETGVMYLDGAGSNVTLAYGEYIGTPYLTNGALIDTWASLYIANGAHTGMTTYYSIWNNCSFPSLFISLIKVKGPSGAGFQATRDAGPTGYQADVYYDNTSCSPWVNLRGSRGSEASPSDILAGDRYGLYEFTGMVNGAFHLMAYIEGVAANTLSPTSYSTQMRFRVCANGAVSPTVAMTISEDKYLGVGTLAPVSLVDVSSLTGGILTLSRADAGVQAADVIGKIQWWNNDAELATNNIYANIVVTATSTVGADAAAGTMVFSVTGSVTPNGSPIECLRLAATTVPEMGFFGHAAAVQPAAYTVSNVTTDRTYDANSTTLDEVADVLGTLLADLKSVGLVGT